jgi:signal transduction histidine kinase
MLGIILSGVVHWDKSTSGYPPEGCDMRTIAKGLYGGDAFGSGNEIKQPAKTTISRALNSLFREGLVKVAVHPRPTSGELVIEVEDKGIGMTPEEQERLFKPYHRVEEDRQRFPGLGLGLAVSKQIIEAHGGKMWLRSERGHGC